jgi:hypothetical protein
MQEPSVLALSLLPPFPAVLLLALGHVTSTRVAHTCIQDETAVDWFVVIVHVLAIFILVGDCFGENFVSLLETAAHTAVTERFVGDVSPDETHSTLERYARFVVPGAVPSWIDLEDVGVVAIEPGPRCAWFIADQVILPVASCSILGWSNWMERWH